MLFSIRTRLSLSLGKEVSQQVSKQAHNIPFLFRPPFQLELHRRGPLGALVTGWVTSVHRRANRVHPVYSLGAAFIKCK